MEKFSSIDSFRHVFKGVELYVERTASQVPVFDYVGTVKLHGTNAGIRRSSSGKLQAQSRSNIISSSNDNFGFAKFVEDNEAAIRQLFDTHFGPDDDVTLFGEWVGRGIQKGIALSELDPHLVLFNAKINQKYNPDYFPFPESIQNNEIGIYSIGQIPFYELTVDFSDPKDAIDEANNLTIYIERECPWGKFRGVTGVGEGLVWIPRQHPENSDLWFKTKGGKHSGKGTAKGIKASISPEQANTIQELLETVLPEWRLQQGIQVMKERGEQIDYRAVGPYLKWINQDILKEESDTVDASGIEWKYVSRAVTNAARQYILKEIEGDF